MLAKVGCYLTTERGGWGVMAITALFSCAAFVSPELSTFALSVLAIGLTQAVLARQGAKDALDVERDRAAHAKLDALVHGVPDADDNLAGIEPDEDPRHG